MEGRRRNGRLKRRWMDSVNEDLRVMRTDVDCGREEKERKTEVEVDGQRECGLEGE